MLIWISAKKVKRMCYLKHSNETGMPALKISILNLNNLPSPEQHRTLAPRRKKQYQQSKISICMRKRKRKKENKREREREREREKEREENEREMKRLKYIGRDIYIYIYIYVCVCVCVCVCIVTEFVVTNSLWGFVANQVRYNLESAQYLW